MLEYRLAGMAAPVPLLVTPVGSGGTDGTSGVCLRIEDPGRRTVVPAPDIVPMDFRELATTPFGRPVVRTAFGVGPPVLNTLAVEFESTPDLRGLRNTGLSDVLVVVDCDLRSCSCLAVRLR